MKIIATTTHTYLIEATPQELAEITGIDEIGQYHDKMERRVGTTLRPKEACEHLGKILHHEEQRKKIACQLRAAATIIETTPSIMTLPPVEKPAAKQLREALS